MADERRPDFHLEVGGDPNTVVQVANLYGNVNLPPRESVPPPRQLTQAPEYYTNNEEELGELTEILRPDDDHEHVRLAAVRGEPGSGRTAFAAHWGRTNEANTPTGSSTCR